jgi:unsaturated rhamnogalacturonyl hydrolase
MYEEGARGPYPPIVRNVSLENVMSRASPRVLWIAGFPGAAIDNIRLANCTFKGVETAEVISAAGNISLRNVTIEPAKKERSLNSVGPARAASGDKTK